MRTRTIALRLLLRCRATVAGAQAGRAQIADGACEQLPLAAPAGRAQGDSLPPRPRRAPSRSTVCGRILDKTTPDKAAQVKGSLAKQRPVLFTMPQPDAGKLVGDLWVAADEQPPPTPASTRCGNALVIVGYDDARYGGAFEVLRDCGATMYSETAFWIRYDDFKTLCQCAVELVATDAAAQ